MSLPLQCYLDDTEDHPHMFRVTRTRGKSLHGGGFGVTIGCNNNANDNEKGTEEGEGSGENVTSEGLTSQDEREAEEAEKSTNEKPQTTGEPPPTYLFLEEVIFLHEQGMLECYEKDVVPKNGEVDDRIIKQQQDDVTEKEDKNDRENGSHIDNPQPLASPQLYAMLEPFGISTASYLVFAHLRQQTFRVIRYSAQRLSVLKQMEETPSNRRLVLQLRHDVQTAPPPVVLLDSRQHPSFAFCVYQPSAQFSKAKPGLPAFLVAITPYGQSSLPYDTLLKLLEQARGIPVKLATVADSGTVVMFGITDHGVPPLAEVKKQGKQT